MLCAERGWCLALPCSMSCWSYHGSSSSVTNSSILPEFSMGDPLLLSSGNPRTQSSSVRDQQIRQAGSSTKQRPLLQAGAARSRTALCCGSTCFLFPSSPPTAPSHPPITAQHRPIPVLTATAAAAATGAAAAAAAAEDPQTWQRCCNNSTSFSPCCQQQTHDAFTCCS